MDTLPLPPRPDLDQYRKRAKSLVVAANAGDASAVRQWADDWLRSLTRLLDVEVTSFVQHSFERSVEQLSNEVDARKHRADGGTFTLADAQHLIARAHSYENWADFAREVEGLRSEAGRSDFERAADAVVTGDLAKLDDLLAKNPSLVRDHSARTHRATLLHYVAANGVEDFRQTTPPNAVEIAQRLIGAGAEVDALADTYGADTYQTTMNLLVSSTHPAEAGLQSRLVEVLLDHGAAVDGLDGNASPILTALAFGYRDAADTLARRGASVDHVVIAAGVGRLDVVQDFVVDARTLRRGSSLHAFPAWVHIPEDAAAQVEMAMVWACKFGRADVARFLHDRGVNPAAKDTDDMTALHWASARGMLEVMDILLAAGAPLEVRNTWGGTVLDSTVWFAGNSPMPGVDYPQIIERLLKAGADPDEVYPPSTGIVVIDSILEEYRNNKKD